MEAARWIGQNLRQRKGGREVAEKRKPIKLLTPKLVSLGSLVASYLGPPFIISLYIMSWP